MSDLEIYLVPCLSDNYSPLIHDPDTGNTAIVDTSEAEPVLAALKQKGWTLTHIFNTHHHFDHVGCNEQFKKDLGVTIVGSKNDAARIPGIDIQVAEGDSFQFGSHTVQVIEVSGHTVGHIAYYIPDQKLLFPGDTLFALGCGRLFEGTPAQMWNSLSKLMALPDDVEVYCAHEYTQSNAKFALTVEPGNQKLIDRSQDIDSKRADGISTIPSTIGLERATNPFVRPDSENLQHTIGMIGEPAVDVFAKVRELKDNF